LGHDDQLARAWSIIASGKGEIEGERLPVDVEIITSDLTAKFGAWLW